MAISYNERPQLGVTLFAQLEALHFREILYYIDKDLIDNAIFLIHARSFSRYADTQSSAYYQLQKLLTLALERELEALTHTIKKEIETIEHKIR